MRVVGIDPSLSATGVADDHGQLHVLKQKPADGDQRLVNIREGVARFTLHADLIVMEDLPRNAMAAGVTGMVQGVIREYLQQHSIPYVTITPATLKKFASGKGNAQKPQMRAAWLSYSGDDVADDNKVDAAWLRVIGLHLAGQLPANHEHWSCVETLRPQVDAIRSGFNLN